VPGDQAGDAVRVNIFQLIRNRFRALAQKERLDVEMEEEMRAHVELGTRQNIEAGMSAEEARHAARRRFGWAESIKETCRDERGVGWIEVLGQDIRYGARMLRKNPGFTSVAVLMLALGIGACTAIFSVVNSVLLRPMPFPESDRLVVLREDKLPDLADFAVAPGNYFSWREQTTSFENLAAELTGNFNLTGTGNPMRLNVRFITANYLATLRIHPLLGRDFRAEEETSGHEKVVLLSYGFWQRQFGGVSDILDRTMQLDGDTYTIIGVLPQDFRPENKSDIYTPAVFGVQGRQNHGAHFLDITGRLKTGVTLDTARREMRVIAERMSEAFPNTNKGWGANVTSLLDYAVGPSRPLFFSLLGAVGFLLLIACANVANLLLARATARAKEISVRVALGAKRARIIRQLLTESVLLSGLSALLALVVAQCGVHILVAYAPADLPRLAEIEVNARAFALTCGLAFITGITFGLVPALQAARVNPGEILKSAGRGSSDGGQSRNLRSALVVVEVAVAFVLLAGAGLLIRSFVRLQNVRPGFQPDNTVAVTVSLPGNKYGTAAQQAEFASHAITQLSVIPGVQKVGASVVLPFSGDDFNLRFNIDGRPRVDPSVRQGTLYYAISPDYFLAMGVPLLRGRFFDSRDIAGRPRVAIINESMAKKFFPNEDPVGKRINLSNGPESFREIVGIVGNVKHYRLNDEGELTLQTYEPFAQQPYGFMTFVVRTQGPQAGLVTGVRAAITTVDKDLPIVSVRPLTELVVVSLSRQRFLMFLFAVFSGAALLLSAMGIYGVISYSVTQRTGEIGIRMALGAQRAQVLGLIFRHGGQLIAVGLVAGLAGALALTRFIASMLFGISAYDPLTFALLAILLGGVAALACFLPARRATLVNPMVALRNE
jgi:predicted permease